MTRTISAHFDGRVIVPDEELQLYHTKDYVEFVKKVSAALDKGPLPENLEIAGLKYNLGPGDNPRSRTAASRADMWPSGQ